MASLDLKRNIVSALCKFLSVNSEVFLGDIDGDVQSLCAKILKSSEDGNALLENNELMKWVAFVENLDSEHCSKALSGLNEDLIKKSVLLGNGFKPSAADVVVFAAIHSFVIGFSNSDKEKFPHLLRWTDYIQDKVDFGESFERILLEKAQFDQPVFKNVKKAELELSVKKIGQDAKETAVQIAKNGEKNRFVLLVTNLKPAKLRDVTSEGMVLCASNQDHTVVEPLIVPEGAKIGECVTFSVHEGKPEDVLNPKKKQLEKITPHLFTDASGIATFKGVPFMTSAGPCKSSIPHANIK